MSVVTILIAAVVAAGISYTLRLIDKDSNSLEKVRKYADERKRNFELFFTQQENHLRGAKAEVEARQDQAAAAVKRLEGQIADFEAMAKKFEDDSNAVRTIEAQLGTYEKHVHRLMEMSKSVDDNLGRLKKESAIVDRLRAELNAHENAVGKLEKSIANVAKDFSVTNGE